MIMWALTILSFFTALCWMAQNFWQLLFARIGVGIGEAGGTPPSHSILADYFKPSQRIVAMMVFTLGIAIGSGIGGVGGGILAEKFGWRHALIIFSLASVHLLLMLMTIRSEERRLG